MTGRLGWGFGARGARGANRSRVRGVGGACGVCACFGAGRAPIARFDLDVEVRSRGRGSISRLYLDLEVRGRSRGPISISRFGVGGSGLRNF